MSRPRPRPGVGRTFDPNMVLLMCVLWAVCAAAVRGQSWGQSRGQSHGPVHHLPLFQHAPEPLVAREMFRPVPHKSSLPHGLDTLLLPPADRRAPGHTQPAPPGPVDVWCGLRQMSVRVDRQRLRHWGTPGLFRLSTCPVSAASPRYLYFHRGLGECGGHVQVVGGQLVYRYSLTYAPPHQGSVLRVPPLNLPLSCHYNRFHYSYRLGYRPLAPPSSFLKNVQSKNKFSLSVCNSEWEVLPPGHLFVLGEPVYFVAQAGALLSGERLYVDSCHVTGSRDPGNTPRVDIITNYGCMMDSVRADSGSHFVWRGPGELRFSVDSLLFTPGAQMLFLHCSMSLGLEQSPTSKSCTYNQATHRWVELDASPSVCSCCDSVCGAPGDYVSSTLVSSAGWHFVQDQDKLREEAVSLKSKGLGLTDELREGAVSLKSKGLGLTDELREGAVSLKSKGLGLTDELREGAVSLKSKGLGLTDELREGAVSLKSKGLGLTDELREGAVSLKSKGLGLTDELHEGAVSLKSKGLGLTDELREGAVSLKSKGLGLTDELREGAVSLKSKGLGLTDELHKEDQWVDKQRDSPEKDSAMEHTRPRPQYTDPHPQLSSQLLKSALTNHTSAQNQSVATTLDLD